MKNMKNLVAVTDYYIHRENRAHTSTPGNRNTPLNIMCHVGFIHSNCEDFWISVILIWQSIVILTQNNVTTFVD